MTKKIIAIFSIICLLVLTPSIVYAMTTEPAHLTIIMSYNNEPLEGQTVAIARVAELKKEGGKIVFGITEEFADTNADFSDITNDVDKNIAIAALLHTYAKTNNLERDTALSDANGEATFTNITPGLYLVVQMEEHEKDHRIAPYLVMAPTAHPYNSEAWEYNVKMKPKTERVPVEGEFISLSVFKVWKGTDNDTPAAIQVQLLCNGEAYGNPVALNAENQWKHTFNDLNKANTWTVDELNVPAGFEKSISGSAADGFIITNTKGDSSSEPPESSSSTPSEFITSLPYTSTPPHTTTGYITNPPQEGKSGGDGGADTYAVNPRTEDLSNMRLWIGLIAAASIGVLAVLGALNSKRIAQVFKKK